MREEMQFQELTTKDFLSHLRRHPIPEIMDEECFAALSSVEAQYGDVITHGAGLEVRLGEEARYVDYIMNIDEEAIPGVGSLWYEIDYEEFRRVTAEGGTIAPCLFANTGFDLGDKMAWDQFLPPFLGEARARNLRTALNHVFKNLPKGASVKQVGTMTSRGELSIMRLVILFPSWEAIPDGLLAIGWTGDATQLREAIEPWKETQRIAVNIDLGENGVLPKIGIEVFSRWRHPVLVDRFITRLEAAGLCLPSKGEALRRWIRFRPDGAPFIQTLINYFKLNYRDGKISEVKAYLEQSPYIHHHYFDSYERPVRLDLELTRGGLTMHIDEALSRINECAEYRIPLVRLYGALSYAHLERVINAVKSACMNAEIVLDAGSDIDRSLLSRIHNMGNIPVMIKWRLCAENADEIAAASEHARSLGATEFMITGMCADHSDQNAPGKEAIQKAADFIKSYDRNCEMQLCVDTCFSPLLAYLGGEDPRKNPNRGIMRGCEAGRSFLAVPAEGKVTTCLSRPEDGAALSLKTYWEESDILRSCRSKEKSTACKDCPYESRCLPCPLFERSKAKCPLAK